MALIRLKTWSWMALIGLLILPAASRAAADRTPTAIRWDGRAALWVALWACQLRTISGKRPGNKYHR